MRSRALLTASVLLASVGLVVPSRASAADPPSTLRWHTITPAGVAPNGSGSMTAGSTATVTLPPAVPPTATAVIVTMQYGSNSGGTGLLMATDCSRAADPATDGIARLRTGDVAYQVGGTRNQAVLPVAAGAFCLTAEPALDVTLTVLGYADTDPSGLAYVDGADTVVFDGVVAAGGVPLSGVPTGSPFALWATMVASHKGSDGGTSAFLSVGPCGGGDPQPVLGTTIGAGDRRVTLVGAAVLVPATATPCLFSTDAATPVRIELAGVYTSSGPGSALGPPHVRFRHGSAPRFTAVDPTRVLDTRDAGGAPVAAGTSRRLELGDVVPSDTEAVSLNVTVTEPIGPGYVTVYPCEDELPLASNLNYTAGLTVPNAVTAALGPSLALCLYTSATAHLVVDLSGWYREGDGDGYQPVTVRRAFDTRDAGPRRAAGSTLEADLSAFVPADATAVVMNVTVTDPLFAGFVTVYPCGGALPTVSNLNFAARATVANLVTVRLPADKRVCLYTQVPAHLIGDVSGVYRASSSAGLVAFTPSRLFDTREEDTTRPAAGSTAYVQFTRDVVAWLMNVTVTDAAGPGFLTTWDCGLPMPTASNVNYVAGQTVPNMVLAAPVAGAASRVVCFYVHAATHYLADVSGYFTAEDFLVGYLPPDADRG